MTARARALRGIMWPLALAAFAPGCLGAARAQEREADPGGGTGDGTPEAVTCAETADAVIGIRVDPERGCLLTEESRRAVACAGQDAALTDFGAYSSSCVRHLASGEEFWLTWPRVAELDEGWERCSDLIAMAPVPCFAAQCPETVPNELGPPTSGMPESTCTEAETRRLFNCGGYASKWDESCCRRPGCKTDADCSTDEICRVVEDPWFYVYAWAAPSGCDRGGRRGFCDATRLCAPKAQEPVPSICGFD